MKYLGRKKGKRRKEGIGGGRKFEQKGKKMQRIWPNFDNQIHYVGIIVLFFFLLLSMFENVLTNENLPV